MMYKTGRGTGSLAITRSVILHGGIVKKDRNQQRPETAMWGGYPARVCAADPELCSDFAITRSVILHGEIALMSRRAV